MMAEEEAPLQARAGANSNGTFGSGPVDLEREPKLVGVLTLVVLNSFVGAYGLIQVSMFMLVLPRVCGALFPGEQAVGLATMLGLAGATQLICPVAGLFSDRMSSPFGRRRPFIVVGTLVALLSLAIMWFIAADGNLSEAHPGGAAAARLRDSRLLFVLAFFVLNLSLNVCFAAYAGLIPDFVSPEQLGEASGVMAVMNAAGALVGVWLIGFAMMEPFSLYAVWLVLCCGLTLAVVREVPLQREAAAVDCADVFRVYFETLEKDQDFFWVWVSRLLYYMGISVQVFMQYFIRDVIRVDEDEAKVQTALVSVVMLACASVVAVPCGILSDHVGRRPLVYVSCVLMAVVYLGWAFATEMWQILAWAALFGFANGTYLSVDYALGCDAIPDKEDGAAQALGVWGVAAFLGSTLGPVISGPALHFVGQSDTADRYTHAGYSALLAVGAIFVLASSATLRNLSSARH